jgi:hypothetical protein
VQGYPKQTEVGEMKRGWILAACLAWGAFLSPLACSDPSRGSPPGQEPQERISSALASSASRPNFRVFDSSFENTAVVSPPGPSCPQGGVAFNLGQDNKTFLFRPLYGATSTVDTTTGSVPVGVPSSDTVVVGTDNQVVRLADGSFLAERDAADWTPVSPEPDWFGESPEVPGLVGPEPGNRGNPELYRSTDCGQTWQRHSVVDFALISGGVYGIPRPLSDAGQADSGCKNQGHLADGSRRWWIGGMDRTELYSCPFTGNLYMATRITSGPLCTSPDDPRGNDKNTVLLLFYDTTGPGWTPIAELANDWAPVVMTSTPNGRLFLFQAIGGQPTIHYSQPLAAGETPVLQEPPGCGNCGWPTFAEDASGNPVPNAFPTSVDLFLQVNSPSISRISTDHSSSKVRVAYQTANADGNLEWRVVRVEVGPDGGQPLVKTVASLRAADPTTHSAMYANFVEPDYLDMPAQVRSSSAMSYWEEAPKCRAGELWGPQPSGGNCGNACTDPKTNVANCGQCQHPCASGQSCSNGLCVAACAAGETACGASCVNLNSDARNCGGCFVSCAFNEVCSAGACVSDGSGHTNYGVRHVFFEGDCRATTPRYLSVDASQAPRTWRTNMRLGDYAKGAFWWDNGLHYLAHWSESFSDATFTGGLMAATTVSPFGPSQPDAHVWNQGRTPESHLSWDNLVQLDGWQSVDIGSYVLSTGAVFVDGVWHNQTTPAAWIQGLRFSDFQAQLPIKAAAGFRLEQLSSLVLPSGDVQVDALWQQNTNLDAAFDHQLTPADFTAENDAQTAMGRSLDHLKSFVLSDGSVRVDAVWHHGAPGQAFLQGAPVQDFLTQNPIQRARGARLDELSTFVLPDGSVRVDAIWHLGPEQSMFAEGFAVDDFRSLESDLRCQGWQLEKLSSFVVAGDAVRVDAVWHRQATPPPTALCQDVQVAAGPSCTGSITPDQVDNGSFDLSGNPPALSLNKSGPFPVGTTQVTLTASNGAQTASCVANVHVVDTTPPVVVPPATVNFSQCSPSGSVTVGTATATDNCRSPVSVTGQVVATNGVPLVPPINVVNGRAQLGFGTHVVRWTASDGTNTSTAQETVVVGPRIQTSQSFLVDDRARVLLPSSAGAPVASSGAGPTRVGADTITGEILSVGPVSVRDRASIGGDVVSASSLDISASAMVTGTRTAFGTVSLPPLPALPAFPPATGGDVTVNSGTQSRSPGSYGTATLNGGTLTLSSAGDYFFRNLTVNAGATLRAPANTRIFVRDQLAYRSSFRAPSGTALASVVLGFAGTTSLSMEAAFNGTLVAPNAAVSFGTGAGLTFTGAFFASTIEVTPASRLVCQ